MMTYKRMRDDELIEVRISKLKARDDIRRDIIHLGLPGAVVLRLQTQLGLIELDLLNIEAEMRARGDEPREYDTSYRSRGVSYPARGVFSKGEAARLAGRGGLMTIIQL